MKAYQTFFLIGMTLATLSTISCLLAFGLPSWIYTYRDDSQQGIDYAGLWTFCLETFFDYRQRALGSGMCNSGSGSSGKYRCFNNGVPMYGCHWIYSDVLREIRWTILNPPFYIAVQIMATVNLILSLLGLFALYFWTFCMDRKAKCPLIFGTVSMFFCSAIGLCEVILYGLRATDPEYYDVPNIRAKSLGAGWGWAVVAFILSGFAACFLTLTYMNDEEKRQKRAQKRLNRGRTFDDTEHLQHSKSAIRNY